MTNTSPADWSPADNPYAIAVSEAQWWQRAVRLAVHRLRGADDRRISWFSSRQIDARHLVLALRQLLSAERLEQAALAALAMDPAVSATLTEARERFEAALPGIEHMRDALTHFDEWSRGVGRGPQKYRVRAGSALRDVAREFWGFAYDPSTETVTLGPYSIHLDVADKAAVELSRAIYWASHQVDRRTTADLRRRVIDALTRDGIDCQVPDSLLKVSPGNDLRIWLSLNLTATSDEKDRQELSRRIVEALATEGLVLGPATAVDTLKPVERLLRGEALCAQPRV